MKVPELKGGQMMTIAYIIAMIIVLVVVYKVLQKIGLIKSKAKTKKVAEEKTAETALRSSEYFDPLILKANPQYQSMGKTKAQAYAAELSTALRGFGTKEEAIFAVFNRLKNKLEIAEISLYYKYNFKKDLLVQLMEELTDQEQVTLYSIISKLPNR